MRTTVTASLAAVVLLAAPVGAQSLFNSAGVGLPVEGLGGRARALASYGVGLPGASLLPSDPAASARLLFPTGVIVAQPSWTDVRGGGSTEGRLAQGSRFPLVGIAYPVYGGTASVRLNSFLDQRFRGQRDVTVDLGGSTVAATDLFEQDGSVGVLSVGYARMLGGSTAVGLSIGRYAGTVERELTRSFDGSTGEGQVAPYESVGRWSYSGERITGGVSTDVNSVLRVAASATWSTDLHADASESTEGASRSFDIPLELRVGASAVLAPGLTIAGSAARADWSSLSGDLGGGAEAKSTTGFGVGIELSQATFLGKRAPLRLGFRRSGLPFTVGGGSASERIFAGGVALTLNETNEVVLATADVAVERGQRKGAGATENFWRGTISVRLASF